MDASPATLRAVQEFMAPVVGLHADVFLDPFQRRCAPYTVVVDTVLENDSRVQGSGLVVQFRTGTSHMFKSADWWLLTATSNVERYRYGEVTYGKKTVTATMLHGVPGCAPVPLRVEVKVKTMAYSGCGVAVLKLCTTQRQRKCIQDRVGGLPPCLRELLYACEGSSVRHPKTWRMSVLGYPARVGLRAVTCVVRDVHCEDETLTERVALPPGMVLTHGMQGALVMDVSYFGAETHHAGDVHSDAAPCASLDQGGMAVPACCILGDAVPATGFWTTCSQQVAAVQLLSLRGLRQFCWSVDEDATATACQSTFAFAMFPCHRCNWELLTGCKGPAFAASVREQPVQWLVFFDELLAVAARRQCASTGFAASAVHPCRVQRRGVASALGGLWDFVEPAGDLPLSLPLFYEHRYRRFMQLGKSNTTGMQQQHQVAIHGLKLPMSEIQSLPGFVRRAGLHLLVFSSKQNAELAVFPLLQAAAWVGPVHKVVVDPCVVLAPVFVPDVSRSHYIAVLRPMKSNAPHEELPGFIRMEDGLEYNVPYTHVVFVFSSAAAAKGAVQALRRWSPYVGPVMSMDGVPPPTGLVRLRP